MTAVEIVIGILLLVMSLFLVVVVLMQSGKDKNLSGGIAGGADTFFGKQRGKNKDRFWSRTTAIVSVIFTLLVITLYLLV